MSKRELFNMCCTLSLIGGITVEQIIHLPDSIYRNIFGTFVGMYFGNFTEGATMAVATAAAYLIPLSFGASERASIGCSAIVGGIAIGFLAGNEILGIGPGSPILLDTVVPLLAIICCAGFGQLGIDLAIRRNRPPSINH